MPHSRTFEELPRNFLPKNDGKNELVIYKKYLMSLICSVMSNKKKGRSKLILIFIVWFEEDLISLYNECKIGAKYVSDKNNKSNSMRQNYHNLKKTVRSILRFCNNMPDMKPKKKYQNQLRSPFLFI